MPRQRQSPRHIVESLVARRRYGDAALEVGLQEWEVQASKRFLAKQSLTYQKHVADKAERLLEELLTPQPRRRRR